MHAALIYRSAGERHYHKLTLRYVVEDVIVRCVVQEVNFWKL